MSALGFESFARPGILPFALPLLLWVLVLTLAARSRLKGPPFYLAALLRLGLALILLVFLAGPQTILRSELPGRLELHVDRSRSMPAAATERALDQLRPLVAEAAGREPALRLDLYAFAAGARRVWSGRAADFAAARAALAAAAGDLDPMASDLARSLELGAARRRADERLGRVIVTDGALSRPEADDRAGRTLLLPPAAEAEANLRLLHLGAPAEIEDGEPIELVLSHEASFAGATGIAIAADERLLREIELDFAPGAGERVVVLEPGTLPPGRYLLRARAVWGRAGRGGDDEPLDDEVACLVEVRPRRRCYLVSAAAEEGEARPAPERALRAQGIEPVVVRPEELGGIDLVADARAVVLDRVAPQGIDATGAASLLAFVERGGGLLVLPREQPDELLAWNRHALAELLPLAGLPEPREPPEDDEPPAESEPEKKLSDPDAEKKEEKEVEAPTHVMLLVIDASASMKEGARIVYAIRGAIATLRKLHPEDKIGVIAYNDLPVEVVPVQPAANADEIERAIARIEPDGATDIEAALEFAQRTLERETAAVKTVVLLSDGYSRPFNVKEVARGLQAAGIAVTTVGVGSQFDIGLLTQIAKYSGGTGPIPARNARQLPAIMVDVAARLVDIDRLRRAPEPEAAPEKRPEEEGISRPETRIEGGGGDDRAGGEAATEAALGLALVARRPASFLDGLDLAAAPPVFGLHRAAAREPALVTLGVEPDRPALAYWRRGDGLVAMTALPLEGAFAAKLVLWDRYPVLVAQLVRFLERDPARREVEFSCRAGEAVATVAIFDSRRREPATGWRFALAGEELPSRDLGEGLYRIDVPAGAPRPLALVAALDPDGGAPRIFGVERPLPAEAARRGLDLAGLEAWAEATGGRVMARAEGALLPEPLSRSRGLPRPFDLGIALGLILLLELGLKRRAASRTMTS